MSSTRLSARRGRLLASTASILVATVAGLAPVAAQAQEEASGSTGLQQIAVSQAQIAQAQSGPVSGVQASDDDVELEQIVVTGTRLKNSAFSSPVPVVQITAEEIDSRGVVRIEDMLNVLPSAFAGQTSEVSNGASGTSTLNLRGIGSIRTLTLINGRRLPFGSPQISSANLDVIPSQLVERIDIVTGGASAVYGSDAIGGVANFILKEDFEGFEFDGQVGFSQNANDNKFMAGVLAAAGIDNPGSTSNGRNVSATMTIGANTADGRGNVTAFLGYQNQNEIRQDTRDISACAIGAASGSTSFQGVGCSGSPTFRTFGGGLDYFQEPDGTLVEFTGVPEQTFNFGPDNFFRRPNERFNINALGHYKITDNIEAYADLAFMNNNTDAQIAASGSFFRAFRTNCDNPLLQEGLGPQGNGVGTFFDLLGCSTPDEDTGELPEEVPLFFGKRNVEGGPRVSEIDNTTWRIVAGFRGQFLDNFDWDVFGQFSRVNEKDVSRRDLNFNRTQDALFIVEDENGNLVCRDNAFAGCVPWDVFSRTADGQSNVSEAAINFIQGVGIVTGTVNQRVVGGTLQSDLGKYDFKSPFAEAGISALIGFEYRLDELDRVPDDISQIPGGRGLTGVGGGTLPVQGQVEVFELFMETQIPLVQNVPFIKEWSLNGAYRRSQYDVKGLDSLRGQTVTNDFGTDTFFVGTTWAPVDDVRFRVQFQRALRAPNVIELFTGQNTGLFGIPAGANGLSDPCSGPNPTRSLAECARTGVSAGQFGNIPDNPARQFNSITGGNPELRPEVSDTITVGAVFTPTAIPGFSLAVDYFNIELEDAIATVPPLTTLIQCLDTGNPVFCDNIQRDRFGSLFVDNSNFEGVRATNVNVASFETTGIDFSMNYRFDLEDVGLGNAGSVNFNYVATWLMDLENTPVPGGVVIECQDQFDSQCGTPNPAYRHRLLATWNSPWNFSMTATWRYFGDTEFDKNPGAGAPSTFLDEKAETRNYIDLVARLQATDHLEMRLGVNNLLGKEAPLLTGGNNGNTFPGVFDLDRFIFFGVNVSF